MGIDYEKCDMCKETFPDCGDNYPMYIEGSDKHICPDCMEKWCKEHDIMLKENELDDTDWMYYDVENGQVKKEYNPFVETKQFSLEEIKEFIEKSKVDIKQGDDEFISRNKLLKELEGAK